MPSRFERELAKSRRRLARHEREAATEIDAAYRTAARAFRADLAAARGTIAAKRAAGQEVSPGLLFRESRLEALVDQAERAARVTAQAAESAIRAHGLAVIGEAQDDLRAQILAAIGPGPEGAALPFATLPAESLNELTAALSPGSPTVDLLDGMAGQARRQAQDELVAGMARGDTPRLIGRKLARIMDVQRWRAELIATEAIFGAHRRATAASFKANRHLLNGWTWAAALDGRTCVVCYAMHGTQHTVDEELHSHPRCRCRQRPRTKSWAEMGFPGVAEAAPGSPRTGVEVFAGLPIPEQRRILGPGALRAYDAGLVELPDFVQRTKHPVWGPGLRRRRLDGAIEAGRRRRKGQVATKRAARRAAPDEALATVREAA